MDNAGKILALLESISWLGGTDNAQMKPHVSNGSYGGKSDHGWGRNGGAVCGQGRPFNEMTFEQRPD